MRETSIAALSLIVLFAPLAVADTIELRDGTRVDGKITKRTDTSVTIDVEGMALDVDMDKIAAINGERIARKEPEAKPDEAVEEKEPDVKKSAKQRKKKGTPTLPGDKNFTDLGIPVQSLILACGQEIAPDGKKEKVFTVAYDPSGPVFVLAVDPDTGETETYPAPVDDHNVYGITLGRDNTLYFSTQNSGYFVRFDIKTKEFEHLDNPMKPSFFYYMTTGPDGKIYCGTMGSMMLVIHDPKTKQSRAVCKLDTDNHYPHSMAFGKDGLLYVGCGADKARVVAFDPKTEKVSDVLPEQKRVPGFCDVYPMTDGRVEIMLREGQVRKEAEWFIAENGKCTPTPRIRQKQPTLKDGRIARIDGSRMVLQVTPKDGGPTREIPFTVDRGGAETFTLVNGPDGNIYGGTYPLNLFRIDPKTDKTENLGNASGTSGEIYSMTCHKGKLYMANYPSGNLSVYDPKKPYKLGPDGRASADKNANPRDLGNIQNFQHRPCALIAGPDGRLYIGVIPSYGSNTGSLTSYDIEKEVFKIHQPYPDEYVSGLAVTPKGELWCVSTKHIFLWDCEKEKAAWEMELPRGGQTKLRLCRNGLLYGASTSGNVVFAFDPKKRKVVAEAKIPWGEPPSSHWNGLDVGPDGLIYGIAEVDKTKRVLYVVSPETHEPKKIGEHSAIHAGFAFTKTHIYLCAGTHVVKFALGH